MAVKSIGKKTSNIPLEATKTGNASKEEWNLMAVYRAETRLRAEEEEINRSGVTVYTDSMWDYV